jgi:hypothetical protein
LPFLTCRGKRWFNRRRRDEGPVRNVASLSFPRLIRTDGAPAFHEIDRPQALRASGRYRFQKQAHALAVAISSQTVVYLGVRRSAFIDHACSAVADLLDPNCTDPRP